MEPSREPKDYERFTGRQRIERDLHSLEGILKGIALDGRILPAEVAALRRWCADHEYAAKRSPFDELIPRVRAAVDDGVLDAEERADILWCCERLPAT